MIAVELEGETDFKGWRSAARTLAVRGTAPGDIEWRLPGNPPALLPGEPLRADLSEKPNVTAPRSFVEVARRIVHHRDPHRFALLYRVLLRLQDNPRLLANAADRDTAWLLAADKAIRRDCHKMHAFVRFRKVGDEDVRERFAAWFEPEHRIVELAAPFFVRRFPNMNWAILTPDGSAVWDGARLRFGRGASRAEVPEADAVEAQWKAYFAAIFNPARLKLKAMTAEMPRKYWRNLPEAELIPDLVRNAQMRTDRMQTGAVTPPSRMASSRAARRARQPR